MPVFQVRRLGINVRGRGEMQFMPLAAFSETQCLSQILTLGSQ